MKLSRRYETSPERGICMRPGCAWHWDGDQAETLAAAHTQTIGHETRVTSASVVIFTMQRQQLEVSL